jgi:hypothetical protein
MVSYLSLSGQGSAFWHVCLRDVFVVEICDVNVTLCRRGVGRTSDEKGMNRNQNVEN